MNTQNTTKETWENVKLPKTVVDKVRAHKEKTLVPIASFIAKAVEEKLKRLNAKAK